MQTTYSTNEGFEHVTCGSTIKLTSKANGYKLHSHGVTYGKFTTFLILVDVKDSR